MDFLSGPTILLGLAMLIAVIIERLLEIAKCIYDLLDSHYDFYLFWNRRTQRLAEKLEGRLRLCEHLRPELIGGILRTAEHLLLDRNSGKPMARPVISGDLVRAFYVKVTAKLVGVVLGIGIVFAVRIDLAALWGCIGDPAAGGPADYTPTRLGLLLTGIAVGLGAGPLHKLIVGAELAHKAKGRSS